MKDQFQNYSYGYRGQECVLKAICEANALQFMRHFDVFGELMHIFFRYFILITLLKFYLLILYFIYIYIVLQPLVI